MKKLVITITPEIKGCYGPRVSLDKETILNDEDLFRAYTEIQKLLVPLAVFPVPFAFEFPFGLKEETLINLIEVFTRKFDVKVEIIS